MRIGIVMSSLHRVHRGAEVALESVAARLAKRHTVTLIGTGEPRSNSEYEFIRARGIPRERFERFPSVPVLRNEYAYEELTWIPSMLRHYKPSDYDVVVGCTFPFTHWALRARNRLSGGPPIVYVTENGDWPASSDGMEYRFFNVDGLVCVNQEYFERNKERYFSVLAPNGVDENLFHPGKGDRCALGLPVDVPILLMVSALAANKRVIETMRVAAGNPDIHFVVAGDGPLGDEADRIASEVLPNRYTRLTLRSDQMPNLYRCANVFVHACTNESFALAYVEALASGVPVVAHDNELTQWILGDGDERVDTFDEMAFLEAIERALASPLDEVRRRVENAQSRFSWNAIADTYEAFLAEVVARHESG